MDNIECRITGNGDNDLNELSFLETHFEVSAFIGLKIAEWNGDEENIDKVNEVYCEQGRGGVYELAEDWTTEFENKYKDVVWGEEADYFDTIDNFLNNKNTLK